MKIQLLKFLDNNIGRFLVSLFGESNRILFGPPKSILIIRPGGIGDAVLLNPMLAGLKESLPTARVDILAEKRNADVFALSKSVNAVYRYDRINELIAVFRNSYDVVIDTEQWHRLSAVVARIISPVRIGFASNSREKLFTHPVTYSLECYEGKSFTALSAELGIPLPDDDYKMQLDIPSAVEVRAKTLLGKLTGAEFVIFAPGTTVPEKRWLPENFTRLAESNCLKEYEIVVLGGKRDRATGEMIASVRPVLNLAGCTSLLEAAAIAARSKLLVTVDSGILHIGAAVGTRTVSLFGPSNPLKWAPRGSHHAVVTKRLDCSPCSKFGSMPSCPFACECMCQISVEEVETAVCRLLENVRA